MSRLIFISTSTFGEFDQTPLQELKKKKYEVVLNDHRRKLSEEEVVRLAKGAIGLIAGTENLTSEVLQRLAPTLKVISRCGVGMDNVNQKKAEELNIKVLSTKRAPTRAVAELTVGLIFDVVRRISEMDRDIRNGRFEKKMGSILRGKNLGIIGYGEIGKEVREICRGLVADIKFYDPALKNQQFKEDYLELDQLLKESDIISLHVPYTKETHHMIGADQLKLMKSESYLINTSRGGIVDEMALYRALKDKKIAGAALDVFEEEPYAGPFKELDNCILTPHIGSYAKEARIQMETEAVQNLIKALGDH